MRSSTARGGVVAIVLVLALLVVVPMSTVPVAAQDGSGDGGTGGNATVDGVSFTVTALEGPACEETFCFDVPVKAVAPNTTLHMRFVNPEGNSPHSFYVLSDGEIHAGEDTPTEDGEAWVPVKDGGAAGNVTYQVPSDASQIYLWCDEPGHESTGMWELLGVGAAAPAEDGGEGGLVAQNVGVPLFSYWVGIIAIFAMLGWLAVTFFVLRYQSSHHTDQRDRKE